MPLGEIAYDQIAVANRQGDGTKCQMFTGSVPTDGHPAVFDADGNVYDAGPAGAVSLSVLYPYGGFADVVRPTVAEFAWVNQGGATVAAPTTGPILLSAPASASDNVRILEKAIPARPYTLVAAMLTDFSSSNYAWAGLSLRDSATGKLILFGPSYQNQRFVVVDKFTNPTAFTAGYVLPPVGLGGDFFLFGSYLRLLKIQDDDVNFTFFFSPDGVNWTQIHQVSRTDWLASPSHIGFCGNSRNNKAVFADLLSWSVHDGIV